MAILLLLVIVFSLFTPRIRRDFRAISFFATVSCLILLPIPSYQDSPKTETSGVSTSIVDSSNGYDSLWTNCSSTCGGGLQKIRKWDVIGSTNGGSQEDNLPRPIRTCNEHSCGKSYTGFKSVYKAKLNCMKMNYGENFFSVI